MTTPGGGEGGGSVEPPTGGKKGGKKPKQVITYLDIHRGGPMTCGSSASDPHDAGRNIYGEPIRPAFISVDALIHRSAKECGPLAYEKIPWGPVPEEHPFRQRVHLRFAAGRIHYYRDAATGATKVGKGVWDWETSIPFLGVIPGGGGGGGIPTCGGGDDDDDDPSPDETGDGGDETGDNPPGGDITGGGAGNDDIGGGPDDDNEPPNIRGGDGGGGGGGGDGGPGDEPDQAPPGGGGGDGGGDGGNAPVRQPPSKSSELVQLPVGTSVANGTQYKHQPAPNSNDAPVGVGPLATPNEIGTPGICGIPANGPVDLRYGARDQVGGTPTPEQLAQFTGDVPVTSRVEFFGITTANGTAFDVDDTSADARYGRGTGPGGVAFLPSNRGLEDVKPSVTTHRNLETASVNEVAIVRGTLSICQSISPTLGVVDGWTLEQESDDDLTISYYDATGTANSTPVLRINNQFETNAGVFHQVSIIPQAASPYTVAATDHKMFMDTTGGAITVNLPAASAGTRELYIINHTGANNVTVTPAGADTLTGGGTLTPGQYGIYQSSGTTIWGVWQ